MTTRLYYQDAYIKEATAAVLSVMESGGRFDCVLDRTPFYPEGGGQPADSGVIGGARVLDVRNRGGDVVHVLDRPLPAGEAVTCVLDWDRRFSLMQNHTGEHIVSGVVKQEYGLNNVGFHMGRDFVTVDFDGALTAGELRSAELKANRAVYENLPVSVCYADTGEPGAGGYRSKKALEGDVRVVRIAGYDACACCGTHCKSTGEIGLIKIVDFQKYKAGVRVFMLCGLAALEDYAAKNSGILSIAEKLSAKPDGAEAAVTALLESNTALKAALSRCKEELFAAKAEHAAVNGGVALAFEDGLGPGDLRVYCAELGKRAAVAAAFSRCEGEYRYALACGDAQRLSKALNAALNGRGGGRDGMAQGSLTAARREIELFFTALQQEER